MKIVKRLGIFIGAVVLLLVAAAIILKKPGHLERRSEGKLLATALLSSLETYQTKHNKYPTMPELQTVMAEQKIALKYYTFGTAESSPDVAKVCSDCHLKDDSFKIAIYGNIDEDPNLDVIGISDREKNPFIILSDIDD